MRPRQTSETESRSAMMSSRISAGKVEREDVVAGESVSSGHRGSGKLRTDLVFMRECRGILQ